MKTRKVGDFAIITEELSGPPPKRGRPSKFLPLANLLIERGKNKPIRVAVPEGEDPKNYYNKVHQGLRACLPKNLKMRSSSQPDECLFWLI